ncbi:hypothetical protein GIB67_038994 [Kingdonia uniflora]|uniref:Uncharacterized protein n=1 Tax=Kingdonia uniflora TaxID=39325 RepID=A0A7J7P6M6_9MAGN|nr:hypothetical protein GIB67_038994 [Kingdonia uniflora]
MLLANLLARDSPNPNTHTHTLSLSLSESIDQFFFQPWETHQIQTSSGIVQSSQNKTTSILSLKMELMEKTRCIEKSKSRTNPIPFQWTKNIWLSYQLKGP